MDINIARDHVKNNLTDIPEKSKSRSAGRCFVIGDFVYRRKDDKPLNEQDILALNHLYLGQTSYVSNGKAGDSEATVHWECDSGD